MRRAHRHATLAVALSLAAGVATTGCSGSPGVHELSQSARSWAGTAQLTGNRWAQGATSRHYTMVALARTSTALAQITESAKLLRDTSALATRAHAVLTMELGAVSGAVATLDTVATHGDRGHTATAQAQLARAGAVLDSVSAATESR